jgi:hypothetical protein
MVVSLPSLPAMDSVIAPVDFGMIGILDEKIVCQYGKYRMQNNYVKGEC